MLTTISRVMTAVVACASSVGGAPQRSGERVDRIASRLQRGLVRNESRCRTTRLGDLDQVVRPQGLSRRGDVQHGVGQPGGRRELHRSVEADELDCHRHAGEEPTRRLRILRGHAQRAAPVAPGQSSTFGGGEHQPARAEAEVDELVAIASRFPEHVLADDAAVCGTHLHVHGDVRWTHLDQRVAGLLDAQRTIEHGCIDPRNARAAEQIAGPIEQRACGEGDAKPFHPAGPVSASTAASRDP